MSKVGDGIDRARTKLGTKDEKFLTDLCDVIGPTKASDGFSGHTQTEATLASNVPCSHKQLSGGGVQVNEGGSLVTKSHELTLAYSAVNVAIDQRYKLRVLARGSSPEMIFERPVVDLGGSTVLLKVFATLPQGYRQPAMT